jgi:hypothetical protein
MTKTFRFALLFAAMLVSALPALAVNTGGGTPVPEPATMAMLASGIGALAVFRRLRNK